MADEYKKSTTTDLLIQALKELGEKVGVYNPQTAMPNLPGGLAGQAQQAIQNRPGQVSGAVNQATGYVPPQQ